MQTRGFSSFYLSGIKLNLLGYPLSFVQVTLGKVKSVTLRNSRDSFVNEIGKISSYKSS